VKLETNAQADQYFQFLCFLLFTLFAFWGQKQSWERWLFALSSFFFCLCFRSSRSRYPWFVPFSSSSLCFVLWSLSIYSLSIPLFFFFVSVLCLFFSFFPAVCRLSLWPSLTFIKPEDGLCSCVCASRSWGTNASVSLRRNRGNNLLFWFVLLCSFSPPFSRFLL
jgi:hypothetical protein